MVKNKPIGITPKCIAEHKRAVELAEAILRFVVNGDQDEIPLVKTWCSELIERLDCLSEIGLADGPVDDIIYHMACSGESKPTCIDEYKRLAKVNAKIARDHVELLFAVSSA